MSRKKEEQKKPGETAEKVNAGTDPADQVFEEKTEETPSEVEMIELSRHKRLQADFENFKRRSRQDMDNMACYGKEQVIKDLLPVMDNFYRALSFHSESDEVEKFKQGIALIFRQLDETLKRHGLSPIEALGEVFDPTCHEAIMQVDADCKEDDNRVLDDLQTGYRLNDKVIRPTMVKVGSHDEDGETKKKEKE